MLKGKADRGFSSVSTFAKMTRFASFTAASVKAGAIVRQGPHQGAQKSTRMGSSVRAMNFEKLASVNTTGCFGKSNSLQLPQTG